LVEPVLVDGSPELMPCAAFGPCCGAAAAFAASTAGGDERSVAALALLATAGVGLAAAGTAAAAASARRPQGPSLGLAHVQAAWTDVALLLRAQCSDARLGVRDEAMGCLSRVLLAGAGLAPPPATLQRLYDEALLPLVSDLIDAARRRGRDAPGCERALCVALPSLLCKPLLAHAGSLREGLPQGEWLALWGAVLDRLVAAARVASTEELGDAVPEALKNCILVFATLDGPGVTGDDPFWELTWRRAAQVDTALTPQLLFAATRPQATAVAAAAQAAPTAAGVQGGPPQGEGPGGDKQEE
jgi:hypothetical protein